MYCIRMTMFIKCVRMDQFNWVILPHVVDNVSFVVIRANSTKQLNLKGEKKWQNTFTNQTQWRWKPSGPAVTENKTFKQKSRWKTPAIRKMTQQQDGSRWTKEWQMQMKVWLHWIFLYETVLMSEIMQSQSCIAEDCCHLELKTTNSWNRNSELLPKHLSIMQSSHIPNVLCYRILFFHLWWTPRVQSKQSDMVQLSFSLSPLILWALPKPSNISPCQKKHGFDISAAPDICSANSEGAT